MSEAVAWCNYPVTGYCWEKFTSEIPLKCQNNFLKNLIPVNVDELWWNELLINYFWTLCMSANAGCNSPVACFSKKPKTVNCCFRSCNDSVLFFKMKRWRWGPRRWNAPELWLNARIYYSFCINLGEIKVCSALGRDAAPYLGCHGVASIDWVSCRGSLYGSQQPTSGYCPVLIWTLSAERLPCLKVWISWNKGHCVTIWQNDLRAENLAFSQSSY